MASNRVPVRVIVHVESKWCRCAWCAERKRVTRLEAFRSWVSITSLPKSKIQRMARAMRGRG